MRPIGLAVGNVDFTNPFVTLSGGAYDSLEAAKEAGAATKIMAYSSIRSSTS